MIEAADTLHRLPDREKALLAQNSVAWPDFKPSVFEDYPSDNRPPLGPPARAALDRCDEVLEWLKLIDGKHAVRNRKIVFYGCYSMAIWVRDTIRWSFVIGHVGNMPTKNMRRAYNQEIEKIAWILSSKIN